VTGFRWNSFPNTGTNDKSVGISVLQSSDITEML